VNTYNATYITLRHSSIA